MMSPPKRPRLRLIDLNNKSIPIVDLRPHSRWYLWLGAALVLAGLAILVFGCAATVKKIEPRPLEAWDTNARPPRGW